MCLPRQLAKFVQQVDGGEGSRWPGGVAGVPTKTAGEIRLDMLKGGEKGRCVPTWLGEMQNTYQGKYYDKGEQKPYIHFLRTAHLYSTKHSPNSLLSSHFTRISIRIRACKLLGAVCMYMTYSGHSA